MRSFLNVAASLIVASVALGQNCPPSVVTESEPNNSITEPDSPDPNRVVLGSVTPDPGADPIDVYYLSDYLGTTFRWTLLPEDQSAAMTMELRRIQAPGDTVIVTGGPGEPITGVVPNTNTDTFYAFVSTSGASTNYAFYFEDGAYSCFQDCNGNGIADETEFDLDWSWFCYCTSPSACGTSDDFAGCPNSTGAGATIRPCNSGSVSADDLILTVSGVPTNNFGVVFMGSGVTNLPFGNGTLCIDVGGLGAFRFPIHNSGNSGLLREGPGIVGYSQSNFGVFGAIAAGQTWNFQGWYRDPGGPCGSTFNLSNGVAITFGP